LGEKAQVCLTVYDVKGRVARVLTAGQQSAGRHEALWDGTDEQGLPTGTGLYLYSLSAGDAVLTRKAVLMK
jgi:flagellar hook assembly protein FlgD